MRVGHATLVLLLPTLISLLACEPAAERRSRESTQNFETRDGLRIVTLEPHLAELVFAAGAGDFLVGVSTYSDYPDEVLALPLVGDAFVVDQEQLALLKPDMLLAWQSGTPQHVVGELSKRGYRFEVIQTRSLADIASALETIGELTGNTAHATQAATDFRRGLRALAAQAPYDCVASATKQRIRVWLGSTPKNRAFAFIKLAATGGTEVSSPAP